MSEQNIFVFYSSGIIKQEQSEQDNSCLAENAKKTLEFLADKKDTCILCNSYLFEDNLAGKPELTKLFADFQISGTRKAEEEYIRGIANTTNKQVYVVSNKVDDLRASLTMIGAKCASINNLHPIFINSETRDEKGNREYDKFSIPERESIHFIINEPMDITRYFAQITGKKEEQEDEEEDRELERIAGFH